MRKGTKKITKDSAPDGEVTRMYKQEIEGMVNLGTEIKISPKSHVTVNKPGYKQEFYVPSLSVLIGIGNDHTADLIMSKDAWEALNAGEKIHISTLKDWKEKYGYIKKSKSKKK